MLTPDMVERMVREITTEAQYEKLVNDRTLDFSYRLGKTSVFV